jgi:hypothetical protein
LTPVIWAGPETEPQRSRLEVTVVIVREANGPVEVEGEERSRQQDEILLREHGVWVRKAEAGRMMCALDWFEMDTEVELAERERRLILFVASPGSGAIDGISSAAAAPGGGAAAGTGLFPVVVSLGGVWRYPGVTETDDPGERAFGERFPNTPRRF